MSILKDDCLSFVWMRKKWTRIVLRANRCKRWWSSSAIHSNIRFVHVFLSFFSFVFLPWQSPSLWASNWEDIFRYQLRWFSVFIDSKQSFVWKPSFFLYLLVTLLHRCHRQQSTPFRLSCPMNWIHPTIGNRLKLHLLLFLPINSSIYSEIGMKTINFPFTVTLRFLKANLKPVSQRLLFRSFFLSLPLKCIQWLVLFRAPVSFFLKKKRREINVVVTICILWLDENERGDVALSIAIVETQMNHPCDSGFFNIPFFSLVRLFQHYNRYRSERHGKKRKQWTGGRAGPGKRKNYADNRLNQLPHSILHRFFY